MIPNYEEGGPPLTDAQVLTFIEWFDFDKVQKTMTALNWRWATIAGNAGIPDLNEIKRTAAELLYRLGPDCDYVSTGGFEVFRHNVTVSLNFIVSSWDEFETEDDRINALDLGLPVMHPTNHRRLTIP